MERGLSCCARELIKSPFHASRGSSGSGGHRLLLLLLHALKQNKLLTSTKTLSDVSTKERERKEGSVCTESEWTPFFSVHSHNCAPGKTCWAVHFSIRGWSSDTLRNFSSLSFGGKCPLSWETNLGRGGMKRMNIEYRGCAVLGNRIYRGTSCFVKDVWIIRISELVRQKSHPTEAS